MHPRRGSSFCVSFILILSAADMGAVFYFNWFEIGDVRVELRTAGRRADGVMLVTVTFVGTLIAIYSVGYMHGDPGYPRFFAVVACSSSR